MYNTYNSRQVNSSPLFLLLFSLTLVLSVSEDEIVREIEEQISKLMETTTITRSVSSKRGLEGIMLRMAGMGFIALSRNEIFAETQSIFQPDDLEEIFPESGTGESRSQYVPTVGLGEKLFTVPSSYLMQIFGRALLEAGFFPEDIFKLKTRTLPCNADNWRSDYRQYRASHHPAVAAALPAGSLKYRLSQFLRRVKTDLSCLDGDLQKQLDSFKVVVSGDIDRTSRGQEGTHLDSHILNVRDDDIRSAVLAAYEAIERVTAERARDWNTVLKLRWAVLLSKLAGMTLMTWGRNIGEWPTDDNDVSLSYYDGIIGRALYNTLFVLSDFRQGIYQEPHVDQYFRDMQEYKQPQCGSTDLHAVVSKPEFSPLLSGAELAGVEKELLLIDFSSQLRGSVSCLTEVPPQFYDLDILRTKKAAKTLGDRLEDIIDAITS